VRVRFVIGSELACSFIGLTLGLRFDPSVRRTVATDAPAELSMAADVTLDANGITVSVESGASLEPAYLLDTRTIVSATDVRVVFGPVGRPSYVDHDFAGVTFDRLAVTLPSELLELDPGSELLIVAQNAALGTTGFTGQVAVSAADLEHPVSGKLLGFPFRFRAFRLDARENSLLDLSLAAELRLEALEDGAEEKWVAFDLAFAGGGGLMGAASAVQPPEAGADPEFLASFQFDDVVRLGVRSARIVGKDDLWAIFFSGSLKLLFEGTSDWPAIGFDEIGVASNGDLLLPDGGGAGFDEPLSVDWHFARLTITKFRFGRPDGSTDQLRLALTGEIVLIDSLPAGASVEGLVVEWQPGVPGHGIRFEGIRMELAVPGSFRAALSLAYVSAGSVAEFRGTGLLEIAALDMAVDVGVVCGRQASSPEAPEAFNYLYLFADAKLLPTGIPIAGTGLSIYGFQGLVTHNMELAVDPAAPVDERYYQLFIRAPVGMTDIAKWRRRKGRDAFGFGVVLGTADKGYALNAKGMLIVGLPDLTMLLQARADFLKQKPDLSTAQEGSLDALMLYASGDDSILIDITAHWGMPKIVSVDGHARAFFSSSDPHGWYLEIGRDEEGKRVVAKALSWNDKWLFSAGFWFRLDEHGVVTGAQVDLDLRKERRGFWVSVGGSARGEMKLFWEPAQWEGGLAMSGRIKAGYRRWSVGLTLSGDVRARVRQPFDVHLHVEACIDLWLDSICKGFDFDWQRLTPPEPELPFRRWAATPRHFTSYEVTGADGMAILETGVVALQPGTSAVPVIQSHSVLSLDFAKPIVDATGAFNEAVALDDGGFTTVGEGSGWSVAHRVDAVQLIRDPDGAAVPVPVWGTWARETLEPNTTLRIGSSDRYGEDGSLTGGFVDGVVLDYCDPPRPARACVSLADVSPGHGRLARDLLYEWQHPRPGPLWHDDDRLVILFPGPVAHVTVDGREMPLEPGRASLIILGKIWGRVPPRELCFEPGHGRPDWRAQAIRGGLLTGNEAWTVGGDLQSIPSLALYELRVDTTAELRAPDGSLSTPLGAPMTMRARFRTAGPPSRPGALEAYVGRVQPASGARPAYFGYDLLVDFLEDYVPKLYLKVGERLGIRLFDGAGRRVTGPGGETLLLPLTRRVPVRHSVATAVWQDLLEANVANGCATGEPPLAQSDAGLALPASLGRLGPNSPYRAELVSSARPDVALAGWSFTTSRFATFTGMVTSRRRIELPLSCAGPVTAPAFEEAARQLGVATIRYVEAFTVTPLVDPSAAACLGVLIEAPEPLEIGTRTTVTLGGIPTRPLANVDGTRVLLLAAASPLPIGSIEVSMTYLRDAGPALPRLALEGDSSPELVSFDLEVALS